MTEDTFIPEWEGDAYQEAATFTGRYMPPKGRYRLRFSEELASDAETFEAGGKDYPIFQVKGNALTILLPTLTVEQGPDDSEDAKGHEIRFHRLSTKQIKHQQASSAGDVLVNFGTPATDVLRLQTQGTLDDWKNAFKALAGQLTPHPVYCDWEATDSAGAREAIAAGTPQNEAWNAARYRGMGPGRGTNRFDTTDGNGGFLPYVETGRTEPDPRNPGQERTVRLYANLRPTLRGFALSKAAA